MLRPPRQGRGWLPDPPDSRDFVFGGKLPSELEEILVWLRQFSRPRARLPERVDLRQLFEDPHWKVRDQGKFNTSSVIAAMDLVEFFERIAYDRAVVASHAYLYCTARKIADAKGDCGAALRNCFKAMRRFGVPPEKYWPYDEKHLTSEPLDPFLFSFDREYAQVYFLRASPRKVSGKKSLRAIRSLISAGFAVACGFATPNRLPDDGDVPFRPDVHEIAEGQAIVLVGYDDTRRIGTETGALLFRNSWGETWGAEGYGWLPYAYVIERLATDFWTLIQRDWIEAGLATRRLSCPNLIA